MGLAAIVRNAVAVANNVTNSLQTTVTHEAWTGHDKYGKPTFDSGIERAALVQRNTASIGAQQILISATVTFLYPVESNGTAGRQAPIAPRDRITLPDGWSQPIVSVNG